MSLLVCCSATAFLLFLASFAWNRQWRVGFVQLAALPWQRSWPLRLVRDGLAVAALGLLLNGCGGSSPTDARSASPASSAQPGGCSFSFTGWSGKETAPNMWWRWSPGTGEIRIVAPHPLDISLEGQIVSVQPPNTVDILLNGSQQTQIANASKSATALKVASLHLHEGENVLTFVSQNKGIKIPGDPRVLAFAIYNLQTHALNGETCSLEP